MNLSEESFRHVKTQWKEGRVQVVGGDTSTENKPASHKLETIQHLCAKHPDAVIYSWAVPYKYTIHTQLFPANTSLLTHLCQFLAFLYIQMTFHFQDSPSFSFTRTSGLLLVTENPLTPGHTQMKRKLIRLDIIISVD